MSRLFEKELEKFLHVFRKWCAQGRPQFPFQKLPEKVFFFVQVKSSVFWVNITYVLFASYDGMTFRFAVSDFVDFDIKEQRVGSPYVCGPFYITNMSQSKTLEEHFTR